MEIHWYRCDTCGMPSNARFLNQTLIKPDVGPPKGWYHLHDGMGGSDKHFCRPRCWSDYIEKRFVA